MLNSFFSVQMDLNSSICIKILSLVCLKWYYYRVWYTSDDAENNYWRSSSISGAQICSDMLKAQANLDLIPYRLFTNAAFKNYLEFASNVSYNLCDKNQK